MIEFQFQNSFTMLRSVPLIVAFVFISPVFRDYLFQAYSAIDATVKLHTTIAYTATGFLTFCSCLWIQLTSQPSPPREPKP